MTTGPIALSRWGGDSTINTIAASGFGENLLLNSSYSVAQELVAGSHAYSGSGLEYIGPDCVAFEADGSGTTIGVQRLGTSVTDSETLDGSLYLVRVTLTAVGTGLTTLKLHHILPDVRRLSNETVTAGIIIRDIDNGNAQARMSITQDFGSGGSPASDVTTNGTNQALTQLSFDTISDTITIPSRNGLTVGSTAHHLRVTAEVTLSSGSFNNGDRFDFVLPRMFKGTKMLDIRPLLPHEELERCQQLYFKTYQFNIAPGTAGTTGAITGIASGTGTGAVSYPFRYPMTMYDTPTVTVYSTATGTSGQLRNNTAAADVAGASTQGSRDGVVVYNNAAVSDQDELIFHIVADGRPTL